LAEIRSKIAKADIIYVGGGNTLRMMKMWRKYGVDELLIKAWKRGVIMC
jgi:dipeptidase E